MSFATKSTLAVLLVLGLAAAEVSAQCCTTNYTVGYAPTAVAAPPVYQTTYYNGWYPGKYALNFTRNVLGIPQPTTTTYTAGYAPYTVGYAPTATYTAARPIVRTAYRPTYPVTYGPVVQSVARPVVLSPVVSSCTSCDPCNACNSCSPGVTQAYYSNSSSNCSSCNSSVVTYDSEPVRSNSSSSTYEPKPQLAPGENPSPERSLFESNKPEVDDSSKDIVFEDPADEAYNAAPPLFAPQNRQANRHPAPVWNAVHRSSAKPVIQEKTAGSHQVGSGGWVSAR